MSFWEVSMTPDPVRMLRDYENLIQELLARVDALEDLLEKLRKGYSEW